MLSDRHLPLLQPPVRLVLPVFFFPAVSPEIYRLRMLDVQSWLPTSEGIDGEFSWLTSPSLPSHPHPTAIDAESWQRAEKATCEIMQQIQPVLESEQQRKAVVEYVQRLINGRLGSEVFPFGSVPLKTYLPDGDIDLTALGTPGHEDVFVADVRRVLELEEHNKDAEFDIKDVQYIHAEVKLVKCLVQNIVVDISFNQIGGLCTLCFLEKVDQLIGKNHIFKRSIILTKAWCYYESRILGAHHGLISTYALETLVLYIFHLFHSSLDGPLAVLYRFLDYFSKFDWDNYCVSLRGPVPISSLPELAAEAPENDGGSLLLSEEFLKHCVESFSVPPRGLENHHRSFLQKHLNIVDALRENNNLGRSVSKANFYRIRTAFAYGARQLGDILVSCKDSIADEIGNFFMSTLDRHGSGERHDIPGSVCTNRNDNNAKSITSNMRTENSMSGSSARLDSSETKLYNSSSWRSGQRVTTFFGSNVDSTISNCRLFASPGSSQRDFAFRDGGNGISENMKHPKMADLDGDYVAHLTSLRSSQQNHRSLSNGLHLPNHLLSQPYRKPSSDAQHKQNLYPQVNHNGILIPAPPISSVPYYPINTPVISGLYGADDLVKSRGTGTYIPNTSFQIKERPSPGNGRNMTHSGGSPRFRSNGRAMAPPEANFAFKGSREQLPRPHGPNFTVSGREKVVLDIPQASRPSFKGALKVDRFAFPADGGVGLGTFGPILEGSISESGNGLHLTHLHNQNSGSGCNVRAVQTTAEEPHSERHNRFTVSYELKDEDDFPPLSS